MRCNVCGCTDDDACINGLGEACSWIAPNLCSFCGDEDDLTLADQDEPLVQPYTEGEANAFLREYHHAHSDD